MIILYFWTDKGHDTPSQKKKKKDMTQTKSKYMKYMDIYIISH